MPQSIQSDPDNVCQAASPTSRGFTLIELLATILVIGLLLSMLLPSLAFAKRKASLARCAGNLRQVGLMIRVYADENEGRLPVAAANEPARDQRAIPSLPQVLSTQAQGRPGVFECAEDTLARSEGRSSSYQWNTAMNGRLMHRAGMGLKEGSGEAAFLLRDLQPWHPGSRRNLLFADNHVEAAR